MTFISSGTTLPAGTLRLPDTGKPMSAKPATPWRGDHRSLLRADPLYQTPRQARQAELAFHTQQIAQKTTGAALSAAAEPQDLDNETAAVQAFLDYMAKSPEERYFEAFLKTKGLSAEDYAAMTPREQQGLLAEFKETLKQRLGDASAERIARAARRGWL